MINTNLTIGPDIYTEVNSVKKTNSVLRQATVIPASPMSQTPDLAIKRVDKNHAEVVTDGIRATSEELLDNHSAVEQSSRT